MDTTNIALNDFASFDRAIFGGTRPVMFTKRAWRSYTKNRYNKTDRSLILPIDHKPTTIEEHQFCHYVMWMTIWANGLTAKPKMLYYEIEPGESLELRVQSTCFACQYGLGKRCPIMVWQPCCCLTGKTEYTEWSYNGQSSDSTYKIAHLAWEE